MSDTDDVKSNVLAYFKLKLGDKYTSTKLKGNIVFTCPDCRAKQPSCSFTQSIYTVECHNCGYRGSIIQTAVMIDSEIAKSGFTNDIQIEEYLYRNHSIKFPKLVDLYFDFYEKNSFDLVPLIRNDKAPFEQDWGNKPYKIKADWYKFYQNGYNIGIKTGSRSGVTVIDFDTKEVPEIFYKGSPIVQKTTRGYHFVYKYEPKIASGKINGMKIDILNDGKQFVAYPSIINSVGRTWNFTTLDVEIPVMPDEVRNYITSFSKETTKDDITAEEKIIEDIKNNVVMSDDIKKMGANSGRNETLVRYGGILRKQLNMKDTEYVLGLLNQNLFSPPLHPKEVTNLVKSLDKYIVSDERDLAKKIFHYLKYAEEGTSQDIERAIGEKKDRIDKALAFLVKEEIIIKRGRTFILVKKIEWREDFPNLINEVNFKVPYFHDVMYFNWGDLLLLGGQTGTGKTTISMNFIKRFVEAGVKPHYICNETGSRFIKTATNLGLKEGDFKWSIQVDPTKVEIEPNSVCIMDWLMIADKAQTDSVLQYFVEQLVKTNSFLIIFMQLKKDGTWFAPNMAEQFPAFAARYIYDEEGGGITGSWMIDKIRDAKTQRRGGGIPCKYDWQTRTLNRIDELQKPKMPNEVKTVDIGEVAV
jgi:hypothetical protein